MKGPGAKEVIIGDLPVRKQFCGGSVGGVAMVPEIPSDGEGCEQEEKKKKKG